MAVLKNEFSWSRSREELFLECRRKYYFHYYGSWGGWEHESDARTREIYGLKNLKTRAGWAGLVILEGIQEAVARMREPTGGLFADNQAFIDTVIDGMRKDYVSSKKGRYKKNPKSHGLVEHEYNLPVEDAAWKANAEHVAACLRNFLTSEAFELMGKTAPADFIEFKKFDSAVIEGIKVFAVPEFCFRAGEKHVLVAPRSSRSTPESIRLKIACQILFLGVSKGILPGNIRAVDLDLVEGDAQDLEFDEAELSQVREKIKASAAEMRAVLRDVPSNQAHEEDFPPTDSEVACGYCAFKRVCPKFAKPGQNPPLDAPSDSAPPGSSVPDSALPTAALKGIKAL